MSLVEIKKQSAEQLATDSVRDYILSGQIAPGARLTEAFLADRFALSRATVRGALQRLQQEGLLVLVPYTGWTVMAMTAHDAWELYTLRASLESLASRLASEKITMAGKARLSKAFERLKEASASGDRMRISVADFELHKKIVELSQHARLAQQYQFVEQQIRVYITWSDYIPAEVSKTVIAHHGPIVQAIIDGDADTAARLSGEHNVAAGRKLVAYLESIPMAGVDIDQAD
ncbi:MAG: GntR family transcriptional regulator [Janthinobacterium lividum]